MKAVIGVAAICMLVLSGIFCGCGKRVEVEAVTHVNSEKDETIEEIITKSLDDEEEHKLYKIRYYMDEKDKTGADFYTKAVSGYPVKLLSLESLGFEREDAVFEGWKIFRDIDRKWYVKNKDGKEEWINAEEGSLPSGYEFALRNDTAIIRSPTSGGTINLYAQWGDINNYEVYTMKYHPDIGSMETASKVTKGIVGKNIQLASVHDLGFEKEGSVFKGWRFYREQDDKWFVRNSEGKEEWRQIEDGILPSGFSYALRDDRASIIGAAKTGTVHLYAEWDDEDKYEQYQMIFYLDENSSPIFSQKGYLDYKTFVLSIREMPISQNDNVFIGWKLHRDYDNAWLVKDSDGVESWISINGDLPEGYSFVFRGDETYLVHPTTQGIVQFYAEWIPWKEEVS